MAPLSPGQTCYGFWPADGSWHPCVWQGRRKKDGRPRVEWRGGGTSTLDDSSVVLRSPGPLLHAAKRPREGDEPPCKKARARAERPERGAKLFGFWQPDDAWLPCVLRRVLDDDQLKVRWGDGTTSTISADCACRGDAGPPEVEAEALEAVVPVPRPLALPLRHRLPPHRYVMAPMVGGSELPFRMLSRRYGTQLCYTPMIYSGPFAEDKAYREAPENGFQTCAEDRPLVAHFCGNDPEVLLAAARHVADRVDAIDLNLGCPQRVAHSSHFGSYLLDEVDRELVCSIVKRLSDSLPVPVFCKIRLLDEPEDTLRLVRQLEASGAALIAVHARYRGTATRRRDGPAHLEFLPALKKSLRVPMLANGNVRTWNDVVANLESTGADGLMSAEGMLDDPCLFQGAGSLKLPRKAGLKKIRLYLAECKKHWMPPLSTVLFHSRRMAKAELTEFQMLEEFMASPGLAAAEALLAKAEGYRDNPDSFRHDDGKLQKEEALRKETAFEEDCRKKYEERMARKAKKAGVPLAELLKKTAVPGGRLQFGEEPSWLLEKDGGGDKAAVDQTSGRRSNGGKSGGGPSGGGKSGGGKSGAGKSDGAKSGGARRKGNKS